MAVSGEEYVWRVSGRRVRRLCRLYGDRCGLRRAEVAALGVKDLQEREEHWVVADLVGKGSHVRTVPVPLWIAAALRTWITEAKITDGPIFRAINKAERIAGMVSVPRSFEAL